ncbi:PREDICTED: calcium uptake protein 1, mitochondrial-like [Tarenaya hassleriana]|uniref:calcium uptake protein 1, mitochondrial-like n=1 Tax=Tarenaya hassleriana TaxID=28532 RepID=UPI00053C1D77|nr:PREDICTED: calcium uptake protein 1, mitochondrial-like [Tarenaya hassleriana]
MPASLSCCRRSPPSVDRVLPLIQRLQIHGFASLSSSPPPPPESSSSSSVLPRAGRSKRGGSVSSLAKWITGIAAGSGLGALYRSYESDSSSGLFGENTFLSFSGFLSASEDDEATADDLGSRSFFQKLALPDYSSGFILGDAYRRKIFFNYEKRLRLQSPPEKVFEYFASIRTPDGELLMKPADLMRAVVPVFPPSESHLVREGYLNGERNPGELRCSPSEFFMLFDVDNDGLISFKEYIFFVTLLSMPESSFSVAFKMFDIDNNGEIDKDEFKKVMSLMRSQHRQGVFHRDGLRTGFKVSGSVENGGLVEYFFGKDGNQKLKHDKFVQFMRDLTDEMLRLEFAHYDYKGRGTISAKDFALSMVAAADASHLSKLLDRVDELHVHPHLRDIRISLEDFKQFAELRRKLGPFSLALFACGQANGLLTMKDFKRAASHVCDISLSDNVIEIAFYVFDSNRDGNLSVDEFLRVLHQRERDISQPVTRGLFQFMSGGPNGSKNCSLGSLFS